LTTLPAAGAGGVVVAATDRYGGFCLLLRSGLGRSGLLLGGSGRGFGLALHALVGLASPTLLFLRDQVAEFGFGLDSSCLIFGGLLIGGRLGILDFLGLLFGGIALGLEHVLGVG